MRYDTLATIARKEMEEIRHIPVREVVEEYALNTVSVARGSVGFVRPRFRLDINRPEYWHDGHDARVGYVAVRIGLSFEAAERALSAFFAYAPRVGEHVMRTDERGCWGPTIEALLRTAQAAGSQWTEVVAYIAERWSPAWHLGEEFFWIQERWSYDRHCMRLTGLSRRRWRYWHLCFNLARWGVNPCWLPFSVLKGIDGLSPRAFRIARAILRAYSEERGKIEAEEFFNRLAGYLRGDTPLSHLMGYLSHGDVWKVWHNYVPKDRAVRELDEWLVAHLAMKKRTQYFLRLLRRLEEAEEHDVLAAARLALWLGDKAEPFVRKSGLSVHDAGINLPDGGVTEEKVRFLFRYAHRAADAALVTARWDDITQMLKEADGGVLLAKGGLERGLQILASFVYAGVKNVEFARVAAECGVSDYGFAQYQDRWIRGLEGLKLQTVPAPRLQEVEELRLVQLGKGDPRALFAGVYTGCCQHPGGAGRTCAWHAHESSDGAIWAVERHGRIIAQAWVWRHERNLVLDSVEATASVGNDTLAVVKTLFTKAAKGALSRLGIERVYVGTSYGAVHWHELPSRSRPFPAPTAYDDSHSVWLIAGEEKE